MVEPVGAPRLQRRNGPLIVLVCLLQMGLPAKAEAQTFSCSADTAGRLSAQADVRCECRWFPEGRITDRPGGYRWDCGLLRGRMNHTIPADLNAYQGDLSGIVLTKRRFRGQR
jgi:hypothetical protein